MHAELAARQRALSLRLAGRTVQYSCAALGRGEAWFPRWWRRYLEAGPEGLDDRSRAHHVAQRLAPAWERTILSSRRRLQAPATPATRSRLVGAAAILAELQALGGRALPSERPSERVLERPGVTAPRVRRAPRRPRQDSPGPQARASNDLHAVELVGPVYLKGSGHRYDLGVGQDAVDGAGCLRLACSRRRDEVRWFRGECGKDLGLPAQVQVDNARERAGWGLAARTLSRVLRRCLRFGVSPVFSPAGEPQGNGRVANGHGWFQEPLCQRRLRRPGELRRERARLQQAVNTPHVHPRLRGQTPAAHRRGLRVRKLPRSWVVPTERLPLAEGRVTFLRRVRVAGTVTVLSQTFRGGQKHRGLYLQLVVDTGRGWLTAYRNGRVLQRWPYKRLND